MREGIKKVFELLNCKKNENIYDCEDINFILTFPTGYGKTTLSLELAKMLNDAPTKNFSRLIHVVPTRSLAKDIEKRAKELGLKYAVQYSYSPSELKSTMFLSKFVITTYDSFLLNLFKASIGEPFSRHGHYDLPRFSIYTSLIHFDEFHLMNDGNSWTSFFVALRHLSNMGVNIILSSATPSKAIEEELIKAMENRNIVRLAVVSEYGEAVKYRNCKKLSEGEYECYADSVKYKTIEIKENIEVPTIHVNFVQKEDEVINLVKSNTNKKILLIVNTVNKAIELYEKLKDLSPCLIHSRFKIGDRDSKLRDDCKIIISTQVIEVGVNISSELMITEQAPITSIVQRVGRLLRNNEKKEGYLYIWKSGDHLPYDKDEVEKTVQLLESKSISLKLPSSYGEIVDQVIKKTTIDYSLANQLEEIAENILLTKEDLEKLLDKICTLTNSFVVSVATDLPQSEKDIIPLDGDLVTKLIGDCLKVYAEEYYTDRKSDTDQVELKELCIPIEGEQVYSKMRRRKLCKDLRKVYEIDGKKYRIVAVKVDKSLYNEEVGFMVKGNDMLGF